MKAPINPKDIIRPLHQAAEKGNADAQYHLGLAYLGGVERSSDAAVKWLQRAVEQGHGQARITLDGLDIEYLRRFERVEQWIMSAERGDADAQYTLGLAYLDGKEVYRNSHKGLWLLHDAAKQEHAQAQIALNGLNDRVRRLRQASGLYAHADAQYHLNFAGSSEFEDEDVVGGLERLERLHEAAEQGNVNAQTSLGDRYYRGDRVAQRVAGDWGDADVVAVKWYAKAARRGDSRAQFKLGEMYGEGAGVEQSDKRMMKWMVRAALSGSLEAQRSLSLMYDVRARFANDYTDAVAGWRMAAEQGSVGAQCKLAQADAMGMAAGPKDCAEALKWLLRAAERGYPPAHCCLEKPFQPQTWQAKLQEYRSHQYGRRGWG